MPLLRQICWNASCLGGGDASPALAHSPLSSLQQCVGSLRQDQRRQWHRLRGGGRGRSYGWQPQGRRRWRWWQRRNGRCRRDLGGWWPCEHGRRSHHAQRDHRLHHHRLEGCYLVRPSPGGGGGGGAPPIDPCWDEAAAENCEATFEGKVSGVGAIVTHACGTPLFGGPTDLSDRGWPWLEISSEYNAMDLVIGHLEDTLDVEIGDTVSVKLVRQSYHAELMLGVAPDSRIHLGPYEILTEENFHMRDGG